MGVRRDERDLDADKRDFVSAQPLYTVKVRKLRQDQMPQPTSRAASNRPSLPLAWFATVLAIAVLQFAYRYLALVTEGSPASPIRPFIDEFTAVFGAGLLFWPVRSLVKHLPLDRGRWWHRGPLYLLALAALSIIHTSLNWSSRSLLYPLAKQGSYHYGSMPTRYFMEFPIDVIAFVIIIVALHMTERVRSGQQRKLAAAQLQQNLTEARLETLRLQLQPHFLFNTLNTISSAMHRDVEAADQMIQRLGDLLRLTLQTGQHNEIPLAQELEILDDYLSLMRARFGDRLEVIIETSAAANKTLVPSMLLQPIVENAIRHGSLQNTGSATIRITATSQTTRTQIEVWDDGPGPETSILLPDSNALRSNLGLGLSATAERLRLMYGTNQNLTTGRSRQGGFSVRIEIPSTAKSTQ